MSEFDPEGDGSGELERVSGLFEAWRAERLSTKGRIPDRLWAEAFRLVNCFGISRVAQVLRLNASALRRKAQGNREGSAESLKSRVSESSSVSDRPLFVPLQIMQNDPVGGTQPASFRFELEYPDGKRLRLSLSSSDQLEQVLRWVNAG